MIKEKPVGVMKIICPTCDERLPVPVYCDIQYDWNEETNQEEGTWLHGVDDSALWLHTWSHWEEDRA